MMSTFSQQSNTSVPTPSDTPVAETSLTASITHATPPEHRRNRKSWTDEEKRAFWCRKKEEKRVRKKAAAAVRKEKLQAEWERLTEEEKEQRRQEAFAAHEKRRASEKEWEVQCQRNLSDPVLPILVFDFSFAWCMTTPDTKSTVSQVKFSYSALQREAFPFRPVLTNTIGREASDTTHDTSVHMPILSQLSNFAGFRRHQPVIHEDTHWSQIYPKEKIVYLTADTDDVLEDITPDTIYIVGAFVDHNQHKGLTLDTARRYGVRTARLPIEESIKLGNRCKMLTVNHVVEVLTHFVCSGRDWGKALQEVMPVRREQQELRGSRKRRRKRGNETPSETVEESPAPSLSFPAEHEAR